jgi:hypothetical protein
MRPVDEDGDDPLLAATLVPARTSCDIKTLTLDAWLAFLLTQIDGASSLEDLTSLVGRSLSDVQQGVRRLHELGAIHLPGRPTRRRHSVPTIHRATPVPQRRRRSMSTPSKRPSLPPTMRPASYPDDADEGVSETRMRVAEPACVDEPDSVDAEGERESGVMKTTPRVAAPEEPKARNPGRVSVQPPSATSLRPGNLPRDSVPMSARPGSQHPDVGRGLEAARQGRWALAASCFTTAYAVRPDPALGAQLAHALVRAGGDVRLAVKAAEDAVLCEPANALFRVTLAETYAAVGLERRAAAEAKRALELAPGNAAAQELAARLGKAARRG